MLFYIGVRWILLVLCTKLQAWDEDWFVVAYNECYLYLYLLDYKLGQHTWVRSQP